MEYNQFKREDISNEDASREVRDCDLRTTNAHKLFTFEMSSGVDGRIHTFCTIAQDESTAWLIAVNRMTDFSPGFRKVELTGSQYII